MKCRIAFSPIFIAHTFGYETKTLSIPKNTLQKLD